MVKEFNYFSKQFSYYCKEFSTAINLIGLEIQTKEMDFASEVFLSLLSRIEINITAIYYLSTVFKEKNVSSSIALLYRSCISDIIFGNYLLIYKSDVDTLKGEVKIMDAKFLKYVKKVSPIEQTLLSESSNEDLKKREREFFNILINRYGDLIQNIDSNSGFIDDIIVKDVKTIRTEFNSNLKLIGKSYSKLPTEDDMFYKLFEHKCQFKNYYQSIYSLWRYYAQFQHYSFESRNFIFDDKENFLYYFLESLGDCFYFAYVLQKEIFHVEIKNLTKITNEIFALVEEYAIRMIRDNRSTN